MGATLEKARKLTYEAVSKISWPGMQKRQDIASNFELYKNEQIDKGKEQQ